MKKSIVILATVAITAIIISLVGTVTATEQNPDYYFAVYFDKEGKVIKVEQGGKEIKGLPISKFPLPKFNRLEFNGIGHIKDASPCCYVDQFGFKWCWPPCQ